MASRMTNRHAKAALVECPCALRTDTPLAGLSLSPPVILGRSFPEGSLNHHDLSLGWLRLR
jgi:hypothetical protein